MPIIVLVIVASAIAVRFVYLRSAIRTELADDLDGPLRVAEAEIDFWRERLALRARLAASLISTESKTRSISDSTLDRITRAVSAPDSATTWLVSSHNARTGFVTTRCGQTFCAEMRVPVVLGTIDSAIVGVRVAIRDSTFRKLDSPGLRRAGRSMVLMRNNDSLFVLARAGRSALVNSADAFEWASAPSYVREAFAKQRTAGTATSGLVDERVVFATVLDSATGWLLLREVQGDDLVERLLTPIAIDIAVVAALLLFALGYLRSRVRIADMRREQELGAVRSDFVAAVSHELRTPLAQIKLFAELLRKNSLRGPAEVQRAHNTIEKEAGRLGILVDNVLSHARLGRREASRPPTEHHVTDVARDIDYVVDAFAPLAAEKAAHIVSTVSEGAMAEVDSQALRQILLNFLENAVKYGPRGQTVTLGCEESAGLIRLWVSDEGPGVVETERESIWQAFQRGSAARESGAVGSGIGLSVVRDLVTRHRGKAWVESAPTGSAKFVVEFASAEHAMDRVDVRSVTSSAEPLP